MCARGCGVAGGVMVVPFVGCCDREACAWDCLNSCGKNRALRLHSTMFYHTWPFRKVNVSGAPIQATQRRLRRRQRVECDSGVGFSQRVRSVGLGRGLASAEHTWVCHAPLSTPLASFSAHFSVRENDHMKVDWQARPCSAHPATRSSSV